METNPAIHNDYPDRLVAICDRITDFFDWSMEREQKEWDETHSRKLNITEDLRKTVYKAKLEVDINYGLGITALYERIETPAGYGAGWADLFGYRRSSEFTVDEIEGQRKFAYIILDLIKLYEDWKTNEFNPMVAGLSAQLNEHGVNFEMPPSVLEAVNKLVLDERFKAYKYRDHGDVIRIDDIFHISSVIGFSSDLTMWLTHVQNQEEFLSKQDENKVFVTMFGKLDEVHPLYSNWLFTIHKGKSIWIMTDQIDFDNPYQKHARLGRRSVWCDREAMYDECDLPYDLFHEIEKLQGANNKLVRSDMFIREDFPDLEAYLDEHLTGYSERNNRSNQRELLEDLFKKKVDALGIEYDLVRVDFSNRSSYRSEILGIYARRDGHTVAFAHSGELIIYKRAEVFFKQLDEIKPGQKAFAVLLIKEMLQYISTDVELEQVMLATEHTATKLLEGATVDPGDPVHMNYWTDAHKHIFNELLETIEDGEEKTTALALRTYDVVKKSTYYNASWLTTAEKLTSLAEWTILEDEKNKLYSKIHALSNLEAEASEWIYKQFDEQFDAIVGRMTQAKNIKFKTRTWDTFDSSDEGKYANAGSVFEMTDRKGVDTRRGYGIGKTGRGEQDCIPCGKVRIQQNTARVVKRIEIRHYQELMWLLGLTDRKQLPKYYRQYRAHNMIPYKGNSNLDQTHPYLRLRDPCSERYSNGMKFDMFMCKTCYNKIKQPDSIEVKY